jgi:hydrogenase maturation protease
MEHCSILVLGVGNILMSDEGAGVYAVRKLEEAYTFSNNVHLLDGGTLGMKLLHSISTTSSLIVADTAMLGKAPGTISRLTMNDIRMKTVLKNSMHQLSFSETLTMAEVLDILPLSIIITIEPSDISSLSVNLTSAVEQSMDAFCNVLLNEIMATGGSFRLKETQCNYVNN